MGIGVSQWYAEGGRLTSEELGDMYGRIALRQLCKDGALKPAEHSNPAG
ncbi:hypothetical protein COPR103792_07910 [Corynebacterium propinquum]|nr:hypothetical protein [Corynebacterium propinquum]